MSRPLLRAGFSFRQDFHERIDVVEGYRAVEVESGAGDVAARVDERVRVGIGQRQHKRVDVVEIHRVATIQIAKRADHSRRRVLKQILHLLRGEEVTRTARLQAPPTDR